MVDAKAPAAAPPSRFPGRGPLLVAGLMLAACAALYLGFCHDRAGVWLSAPLDDTFIHFQYARQLARGRPLQWNDGDGPTSGATSLLYMAVLAPGWLVGFRGLNLLIFAWILNSLLHLRGSLALFAVITRLGGPRGLAYGGMLLYLGNGPMLWGVFSHMEIALFATILLLCLESSVELEQASDGTGPLSSGSGISRFRLPVLGSLLALTRPEGMVLAGGLSLWLLVRHLGSGERPSGIRALAPRLLRGWPELLPLGMGVLILLGLFLATGHFGTNANIKSHLQLWPYETQRYLETSLGWLPMTLQILLDKWPGFVLPLTTILGLVGLAGWAAEGRDARRLGAGVLVLGWMVLLTLFYAFLLARRDHFDRYYLPYLGLTVAMLAWPLARLAQRVPSLRRLPGLLCGVILLFMVPQTVSSARRFGDNSRDLARQHFEVARWVDRSLPREATIAVNDAGAIPYLSGRYAFDIVGLCHDAFYRVKKYLPPSDAPAWEALEALPRRPDYMVAYPEWLPEMYRLPIFEEIRRFPLPDRTIVANENKIVWKLRWERLADSGTPPPLLAASRRLNDALDIAHIPSEQGHGYQLLDRDPPVGSLRARLVGTRLLVDGGRQVRTGERFELGVQPGKPALLILRTAGPGLLDLQVSVDGRDAGVFRTPLEPDLCEKGFPLSAAILSEPRVTVTLKARRPYASYHVWLMQ